MEIYDKCVGCGEKTPYPKELDIIRRHCYIEGTGQFCIDCFKKLKENDELKNIKIY